MFGFKTKKVKPNALIEFCVEADDAILLAYEQQDITAAVPFCETGLLHSILEEIQSGADLLQEYGIAKYRIRTFDNIQDNGCGAFSVCKHIRHKDVSIRGMISIPVGDNIDEDWLIQAMDGKYKVVDIRRKYDY